ncbi:MAG TPA: non-ribosomal peptide synthetase [Bryobacteraceae bacterium]|nr:non-ribosomal peptide synthetase [Bryobacteraceae bacterium]
MASSSTFKASDIEQSIGDAFEIQAAKHGDRLALGGRKNFTYAQLNSLANALGREILDAAPSSTPGVEPVAVLLPRGQEAVVALLATLKAGKLHVALDAGFPRERLAAQLADSQARLLLTSPAQRSLAESLAPERVLAIEIPSFISPCANLGLQIPSDSAATIQYTSGSTGAPKGVINLHGNIIHNVYCHASTGRIGASDHFLPNGLLGSLNALLSGASVFPYAVKEFGLASLSGWLRENGITVMSLVPTTFRRFAAQLSISEQFPNLRLIKLTGEAIYPGDIRLFQERFAPGCFLQFSYALTEAGSVAWRFIGHEATANQDLVPVGLPVPGKEVLLLDDQHRAVPAGAAGEIAVRSRYLAAGYWRQPEQTEARFLRDPSESGVRIYLTGDVGRMDSDGMLVHLGRKDSQVKIRANRVELAEVEAVLRGVDGVGEAVVVARPDESGENYLAAYFVPSSTPPPPFGVVRRALAQKLPDYMVPAAVMPLTELPLLPNGKVNRNALPEPPRRTVARESREFTRPRTPMELLIADCWRNILRVDRVGTSDNFFDLGGDSLAAVELATELERQTGVRVSPVSLASQTLAQLAASVEELSTPPSRLMRAARRLIGGR